MRTLSDLTGLQWYRPSFWRREFELRAGDEIVGTLKFRGVLRPVAVFESREGAWTFARAGFFQNRGTIRVSGQSTNVAEFRGRPWTSAGELVFASGGAYALSISLWMTRMEVRAPTGEPVVAIHRRGLCGRHADVEIVPAARALPETPLLVAFGWFLFVMLEQDAGAVVATG
jgi:hypothetical protein